MPGLLILGMRSHSIRRQSGSVARKNARPHQARILVAGDKSRVRDRFVRILRAQGDEVIVVASLDSVMTALRSSRFDLLLLDLDMADVEGFGILREIRRTMPQVHVLAVSGNIPGDLLEIAIWFGAAGTMEKHLAGKSLLRETRRLLGQTA
jgi:DNA-binding NtrC family response regulator